MGIKSSVNLPFLQKFTYYFQKYPAFSLNFSDIDYKGTELQVLSKVGKVLSRSLTSLNLSLIFLKDDLVNDIQ